jgi:hypothetical protein
MNREQKQIIELFALRCGLVIERLECDRAILNDDSQRKTKAIYITCQIDDRFSELLTVSLHKADGTLHNSIGPAWEQQLEGKYEATLWYRNGVVHRDDGPAYLNSDGTEVWYRNGRIHRDDDLPAVIEACGWREYWVDGVQIRVETPEERAETSAKI